MSDELNAFSSLYAYLSLLESELDLKIKQTMVDVKKLQDIYETIRPTEDNTPKENKQITQLINLAKGIDAEDESEKKEPPDPFIEFQKALEDFNKIPGKKHKELSQDFINRILDFTPKTEAHVIHSLLPCIKSLNHELDLILQYDMDQPSFNFRACYETERSITVIQAFERELENFEKMKFIECPFREKSERYIQKKKKQHQISPSFESFASLKIKQLSAIFRKRGEARKTLVDSRIRDKLGEVLLPFLQSESEEIDDLQKLKTAAKFFPILANNNQTYALIIDDEL